MAKSHYSTVFDHSADAIWTIIRDFNNYSVWVEGAGESHIEQGKSGDAVGAVRNVLYDGKNIRQRLLALSDLERSHTYEFADAGRPGLHNFQATLRVTPVVEDGRAFVEWWATFDCEPDRTEELTEFLRTSFARWLRSLNRRLESSRPTAAAPAN
jgi:hypothetical protein